MQNETGISKMFELTGILVFIHSLVLIQVTHVVKAKPFFEHKHQPMQSSTAA